MKLRKNQKIKKVPLNINSNQLLIFLKNCLYAIYWDDENRIFFTKEFRSEDENRLLKLPRFGEKLSSRLLCFNELIRIEKPKKLLELLEQKIHNLGATNKNFRYKEIFKIFLSK